MSILLKFSRLGAVVGFFLALILVMTGIAEADVNSSIQITLGTYLGGDASDYGTDVAVDAQGYIYLTGVTLSTNWPVVNAAQPTNGGGWDVYVMKLDPTGQQVIYSTYLGGSGEDDARTILTDGAGNAYITGTTKSTDFPILNPLQDTNHGDADLFVTILNADGAMIYSTYLGGSGNDGQAFAGAYSNGGISTLKNEFLYLTTRTASTDFPLVNPLQATFAGKQDCLIVKLDLTGNQIVFSTYLGGNDYDEPRSIKVDNQENVVVGLSTGSSDFPTVNPIQTYGGNFDAAISKISADGTTLLFATYLGGSGDDGICDLDLDAQGNPWIIGATYSDDLYLKSPIQSFRAGRYDQFIAHIDIAGDSLLYNTYYGGTGYEVSPSTIIVAGDGTISVIGFTQSFDFPQVNQILPPCTYGTVVIEKLTPTGELIYSSYFDSGTWTAWPAGSALDQTLNLYITGDTYNRDFPMFHPIKSYLADPYDGFLVKISPIDGVCGDADGNGAVDISDAVMLIAYVFSGGQTPAYLSAGDPDGNVIIDISDVVYLITYIFAGGPRPCPNC